METLTLETREGVAWVWLDQPRRLNAINPTTLQELQEAFAVLDADVGVRAIILAARGPVFCAGFDVAWMAGQSAEAVATGLEEAEAVYNTIEGCTKPVIAAVQGAAVGGGLLLALVADLRLASEGASFGAPEVKIGIFPSLHLVPRLERLVGLGAAKSMVLTGRTVNAAEAQRLGLVESLCPAADLHTEAGSLAARLAGLPPTAVRLCKEAFRQAAAVPPGFVTWEREQFAAGWASPEREAAMRTFLQRRQS